MDKPLRIAFVWDWNQDPVQLMTWEDGLYAALQELRKRGHEVTVYTLCEAVYGSLTRDGMKVRIFDHPDDLKNLLQNPGTDVVLHWADMTRPHANVGRDLGYKQAICFAGGDPFGKQWQHFDHVFVESEEYHEKYKQAGVSVSTAFGANTKLYDPEAELVSGQAKLFDVVFPATFAAWKRHGLLAEAAQGYRTACAGYMYTSHETECWRRPQEAGSLVTPHLPASALRHLLAAGRVCVITSANNGGSQRTVLEAMAMNVPVIVMDDSRKTSEYVRDAIEKGYKVGAIVPPEPGFIRDAIEEWKNREANGRQYVLETWSHVHYADAIEAGLNQLVGTR